MVIHTCSSNPTPVLHSGTSAAAAADMTSVNARVFVQEHAVTHIPAWNKRSHHEVHEKDFDPELEWARMEFCNLIKSEKSISTRKIQFVSQVLLNNNMIFPEFVRLDCLNWGQVYSLTGGEDPYTWNQSQRESWQRRGGVKGKKTRQWRKRTGTHRADGGEGRREVGYNLSRNIPVHSWTKPCTTEVLPLCLFHSM